jgi:homospermidine synthase
MAKKSVRKVSGRKYLDFKGRMVMVGFGSIGQGVLPLIFRHIGIEPSQITIVTDEMRGGEEEARRYGVKFVVKRLTRANYRSTLAGLLGKGDFLVNLSVEVASTALVELCQ